MAVEYEISSDVATIKDVAPNTQVARVVSLYSGQITYDDEAGSKFATATIDGKSQRVMLCIAVNGTVTYDDVPCLYSTVDGHRCLNIVAPTETGTPDDVPSLCETVVIDGMNVRAVRCILINETPIYDGVSSTCTFVANGKTHTAQLVNQITGGAVDVIIKGVAPLSLPDAIANSLQYVKAFGGTEQNGTPTPDAPVDIVCNNGALKVRHQSGLPLGYQPYEYITAGGNQWLDTGVKLANTDIVETEFKNSSSTGFGALYGVFAMGDSSAFYANGTYYGYDVINNKVNTGVSVDTNWHTLRQDFGNGIITLDGSDTTYTPFEFDNSKNNYLFARYYNNGYGYGFKGSCKRFKVIRNGVVICDLIPAVQLSDNEIGMYDLVNDVFRGNVGSGDFTATNPVNDLETYVDGTVETIGIIGKNLFNKATVTEGFILTSGDAPSASTGNGYSDYIPIVPGQYYYIGQRAASTSASNDRVITYDKDKNVLQQIRYAATGAVYRTNNANARFIRFNLNLNYLNTLQFELGQTPTDYEPYFNGGTATCEPLLAIGDYTDVQEILSGAVTRNIGIKILDGTENWAMPAGSDYFRLDGMFVDAIPYDSDNPAIVCSHFVGRQPRISAGNMNDKDIKLGYTSTYNRLYLKYYDMTSAADLKAWLASQYAAGTPVIIVYPLATAITESVTGQTLQVTAGDNTLEITQASMSGLQLEAKYKAAVELTVQEVQDANLDPNVEVTIH